MAAIVSTQADLKSGCARRIAIINGYLTQNPIPWDRVKAELGAAYVTCVSIEGAIALGNDEQYVPKSDTIGNL